jgi:hypothetical protein
VCVVSAAGSCGLPLTAVWWSIDVSPAKVHVKVLDAVSGAAAPASAYHTTATAGGANGSVTLRLGPQLVSATVQLWADEWGMLDETFAGAVAAAAPRAAGLSEI